MRSDNGIDKETGKPYKDLTDEEFIDCFGIMKCSQCSRHQKCKRLEQIELARPWFASVSDGRPCKDFLPPKYYKLLLKYWRGIDIYYKRVKPDDTIAVCLNHDQSIRYCIKYSDFYNDTMFDDNGNLKWIYKQYYKQTKKSPTGYKLVKEYNKEYNKEG